MKSYTRWAKDAIERTVRSFAFAILAVLATDHTTSLSGLDYKSVLLTGAYAAGFSVLTILSTLGQQSATSASVQRAVNGKR